MLKFPLLHSKLLLNGSSDIVLNNFWFRNDYLTVSVKFVTRNIQVFSLNVRVTWTLSSKWCFPCWKWLKSRWTRCMRLSPLTLQPPHLAQLPPSSIFVRRNACNSVRIDQFSELFGNFLHVLMSLRYYNIKCPSSSQTIDSRFSLREKFSPIVNGCLFKHS